VATTLGIWGDAEQAEALGDAARLLGATIASAGCAVRARGPSFAHALAADLAADPIDLLDDDRLDVVLLAAAAGPTAGESAVARAVARAASHGRRVASLAPIPMPPQEGADEWHAPVEGRVPAAELRFGPLLRRADAFTQAAEVLEAFGQVRSAAVTMWRDTGGPATGAALLDAADLLASLLGEPETVDASAIAPGPGPGGRGGADAARLDALTGELRAHMRFADGAAAVLLLGDNAGAWSRGVTLVGPRGRLEIGDGGHRWVDPKGALVDASERRTPAGGQHPPAGAGAIADFLRPIIAGLSTPPLDGSTLGPILAATLLSARTGQAESPSTLRSMA